MISYELSRWMIAAFASYLIEYDMTNSLLKHWKANLESFVSIRTRESISNCQSERDQSRDEGVNLAFESLLSCIILSFSFVRNWPPAFSVDTVSIQSIVVVTE